MKLRLLPVSLLIVFFHLTCNTYEPPVVLDYSIAVSWPSATPVIFTKYTFTIYTGDNKFASVKVSTDPAGFIDSSLMNKVLNSGTATTVSGYFLKPGTCKVYLEGLAADQRTFKDSCTFTVRNPYTISGPVQLAIGETGGFRLAPLDTLASSGLKLIVNWKVNDGTSGPLDATAPFLYAPITAGAQKIAAIVVDTAGRHSYAVDTIELSAPGHRPAIDSVKLVAANLVAGGNLALSLKVSDKDSAAHTVILTSVKNGMVRNDTILLSPARFYDSLFTIQKPFIDTGSYVLTITVLNATGMVSAAATRSFTVISNMTDLTGPVFFQKSGPANNAVVTAPNIVVVDSIVDPSGIDTVLWILNGTPAGTLKPDAANKYTITAQLTTYHANRIIIVASDKSANHNKSADTIILDYNVPPLANDQTLSTKKDTPLAITLTANAVDGDALSNWTIVTQQKNGALSGTVPNLTYTATTGFTGLDSLSFTVSDGINTSLPAKIRINVSDALVAPKISNQLSDTAVNQGTKATFFVVSNPGANPTPAFSWKKEGQTSVICSTQAFSISQTKYSDEGKYRCVVSNSQGTDSTAWVSLTIRDVTKPAIILKGANPQNIILGSPYIELGDSAYDDRDGIITSKVVRDTAKVNTASSGTYKVTYSVKDSAGNRADTVTRTVVVSGIAPTITNISGNQKVCVGVQSTFSVTASGTPAPRYQWMKGTAAAPGTSTNGTYQITPGSVADAGNFYCIVSNGISPDAQTQNMSLTVDSPPVISIPNHDSTIIKLVGDSVKMTVTASGSDTLHYQWYKGNTPLGTVASIIIKPITFNDSGSYSCSVTNSCKTTNSGVFTIIVNSFPSISTQPLSQTLYLGQPATFSVVATGKPALSFTWRKNGAVLTGATSASYTIPSPGISDSGKYTVTVTNSAGSMTSDTARFYAVVKNVAAGGGPDNAFSLFLKTDGTVWACGDNTFSQFGDGTTNSQTVPVQITSISNVQGIVAGATHSLFLKNDGTLWACGNNGSGQLGDGTTTNRSTPVQMINMSNVLNIVAGYGHNLILKKDGTVWACGDNTYGQLGDGTTIDRPTPIQITSIINVQSVAAGGFQSLMLKVDGTLWVCGYNFYGSLGDGTTIERHFPIQVASLNNNVKDMSASGSFSMLLKTDGTLWACGYNGSGQLGDGTTTDHALPAQVNNISDVQGITSGGQNSLILKTDASLWGCGNNFYGQLGIGNTNDQNTPFQINNMNSIQTMASGEFYSLILKKDGTVWSFGDNSKGQLGNGTTVDRSTPVRVSF